MGKLGFSDVDPKRLGSKSGDVPKGHRAVSMDEISNWIGQLLWSWAIKRLFLLFLFAFKIFAAYYTVLKILEMKFGRALEVN